MKGGNPSEEMRNAFNRKNQDERGCQGKRPPATGRLRRGAWALSLGKDGRWRGTVG